EESMAAMVYFGRKDGTLLTFAIQFICMEVLAELDSSYVAREMPTKYYLIMDEELFDQRSADITEWIEEYGESYYDNVMIKRSTNSVFDAYLSGHDVRAVLFPVDRLLRLAEVNAEGL